LTIGAVPLPTVWIGGGSCRVIDPVAPVVEPTTFDGVVVRVCDAEPSVWVAEPRVFCGGAEPTAPAACWTVGVTVRVTCWTAGVAGEDATVLVTGVAVGTACWMVGVTVLVTWGVEGVDGAVCVTALRGDGGWAVCVTALTGDGACVAGAARTIPDG
jgi:hypothetical protein